MTCKRSGAITSGGTHASVFVFVIIVIIFVDVVDHNQNDVIDNDDDDCTRWGAITSGGIHASGVIFIIIIDVVLIIDS